ncbi:MAG: transglutaminase-like domain-containing protein [Planctomycetes bacterium]|nr:transglutaminase-like domain-containing protein [Planctomycetota bacterium]
MTGEAAALRARFEALLRAGEDALDLGEAALLIGAEAEPGTDVARWLRRLDALGDEVRPRVQAARGPADQALALCRFLYDEYGLRGNRDAYYDPRNSYLHHVLARGLGIPITLAVVLVEVGRRAGLPLVGVGFPAHFLVRHRDHDLFLDPFDQGRPLSLAGCRALLEERAGGAVPFQPDLLRPASGHEVLARMLRNLKAIHLREGDLEAALGVAERLVLVRPDDPEERRDRGLLSAALRRPGPAVDDLAGYLARRPAAPDARAVRAQLEAAKRRLWELN